MTTIVFWPFFAQSGSASPSDGASATASASPIVDGQVVDAATNTYHCVDANPVCVWVHQVTGNALVANWFGTVVPVVLQIILILVATWIVTKVAKRLIIAFFDRAMRTRINPFEKREDDGAPQPVVRDGAKRKRARTLGHLVGSMVTIVCWAIAIMMGLSQIGLNVAPLLASAGIAGIALGFGAQSLVKDYLTGLFLIVEGQYAVGDWIKVDEAEGEVESISLRITRLRDSHGTVWFIPNGTISRVANMTKLWSKALVDLPLSPAVSYEQVETLVNRTSEAFAADPNWNGMISGTPEFWGVQRVDRFGPVYRVAITTVPGQQWKMQRMYLAALKRTFDEAGINLTVETGNATVVVDQPGNG